MNTFAFPQKTVSIRTSLCERKFIAYFIPEAQGICKQYSFDIIQCI